MRGPARAWIGLGGNRKDSAGLLEAALARLAAAPRLTLLRHSRLYRSPPWGYLDQPDFVNSVAELETKLSPLELLAELQAAEGHLGREPKTRRWGPRSIDLDLLTYEDLQMRSDELELPHPRMHLRAFVLVPLLELEPDFVIPGTGPAADCLDMIDPGDTAAVAALDPTEREDSWPEHP
jgi:2-amino-4-hydroxy-6-hydroxymethyldihydropteridine diphosphokinase